MIVLITGATAGFGRSTALLFAKNGYHTIITGRRQERLDLIKAEIEKNSNVSVLTLCFDVRDPEQVKKNMQSLDESWNKIDILVNNAGLAAGLGPIQEGLLEDWENMIDTNIKGLLYITRQVTPMMIKNGKGHIINIGSIAGKEVYPNGNVYCATKHAVDALSSAMRLDMLQHGIRVTAVHPGMAETEFSIVRYKGDQERAKKVYEGIEPLTGEDIAEAVVWAATRPDHVNISEIILTPAAQGNATSVYRKTSA
jgi:3-hydroxy acid dehydrogenase/malonic semialdehyde reductase